MGPFKMYGESRRWVLALLGMDVGDESWLPSLKLTARP